MNILFDKVNDVIVEWNPIGVDSFIAKDEYKAYIPLIIKNIQDQEILYSTLNKILVNELGLDFDSSNEEHTDDLKNICKKLFEVYNALPK